MNPVQKTLIDIASVSQRVVNALTRYTGHKTVESFCLDKIIISSGSILEILNKKLPPEDAHVDSRLVDWLNSREPQVCLDTLNQMGEILDKKVEYSTRNFFKALHSPRTQDKHDEAIKLFQMRQEYFHFLLTTDVWNRERNVYQRSQASFQCSAQRTEGAPLIQNLTNPIRRNSEYTSSVPRNDLVNQGIHGKLSTILGWLNGLHSKDIHRRTLLLRQPDTCTWLPKTKEFKAWRKTNNSFLWLRGKAGAGKSVLTASAIEHVENTLQDGELLLSFYCDFRNKRSTSTTELMRSLLSQILQPLVQHTLESRGLIDDLEREGTLIVSDLALLIRYISRALRYFKQQPICIIDALDECSDIEELLDALTQLKDGGIRLFVSSRPLQVIKDGFLGLPSISMDKMNFEVAADIALHVERELDSRRRLRILEASLKNEIGSALCDKADGMFRWVQCQLNTLKRCMTAEQIRKTLDDLPRDLDATYSRILLRIDEYGLEVVRQALYWLMAAFQSLELCQILEALSVDLERRVFGHDSTPVHGPALLDALDSLVTYDELTDLITFSHASVKEYLIAESTHSKYPSYHVTERDAHTKLALLCMGYIPAYLKQRALSSGHTVPSQSRHRSRMQVGGFGTASHATQSSIPPSSEPYPLLSYVQSSGFRHLAYVDPADKKIFCAIETFESDLRLHPIEWERLRQRFHTHWPGLEHDLVLYILIAFAPAQLLRLYVDRTRLKQKDGTNPLIYAALHEKIEHATILLSKGACVEHEGWDLDGHRQSLPLEVAATSRDPQMVDLFLTEGSRVPYELFESLMWGTYLFPARVALKLLQADEFVEWASTVVDKKLLLYLLDPSVFYGGGYIADEVAVIETIESRLIQVGCDPSIWFDETSLCNAVLAGRISIVKHTVLNGKVPLPSDIILHATSWEMMSFLLDSGNNIDVVSPEGNTLLHQVILTFADSEECLATVRALIDAGCNPSACNLTGESPLHAAATLGIHTVVEYLLSLDVPLPYDILLVASGWSIISFLLDQGVSVHAIAAAGDTVLHTAFRDCFCYDDCSRCLGVTKLLINAGCNSRSLNVFGETPLHIAAKGGHMPVVQYLLSLGIPLPSDILLSVAGEYTPTTAIPLIKFLLDNGADVHAMSPNGDNLLCISAASDSIHVTEEECLRRIKILIGAGCDPHVRNKTGESVIYFAASRRHTIVLEYLVSIGLPVPPDLMRTQFKEGWLRGLDIQLIRFLLDKGCDTCVVADDGDTLLHLAACTEDNALDLAKLLVQSGCSPTAFNSAQQTPIHIASRRGAISVISYFLSLGLTLPFDILLAPPTGCLDAAKGIRYLIQHGADATATDAGSTPLHQVLASSYRQEYELLPSIQILIEGGCDPKSQNLNGETPMHFAAQCGRISIVEYLLSRGVPPPRDILFHSTAKVFPFFLRNGDNAHNFVPILPLHRVLRPTFPLIERDCLERARFLVSAGCDPSVENWLGETPIHIAARNCHVSVIKYLLSQNAPLPSNILLAAIQETEGLCWCYSDKITPLLRFLIREGADANASTDDGDTPLHLIVRHFVSPEGGWDNHIKDSQRQACKAMVVLLDGGANPSIQNASGKNVFDLAEEGGQFFKDNFLRLVRNAGTVEHMRTMPTDL